MNPVIVIGGGSSVKEGLELGLWEQIKGQDIIACNDTILHIPYPPKYAVWLDRTERQKDVIAKALATDCIRITQQYHDERDDNKTIRFFVCKNKDHFERGLERGILFAGKRLFTGIFSMSLALYLGYETIYLLGFDWNTNEKGETEWYKGVAPIGNFLKKKGKVREDVNEHDVFKGKADIYNVSTISMIPSFPKINYKQFFQQIRGDNVWTEKQGVVHSQGYEGSAANGRTV